MTEKDKKPSIPIHPIVFSLKGKLDALEKRLEKLECQLKNSSPRSSELIGTSVQTS